MARFIRKFSSFVFVVIIISQSLFSLSISPAFAANYSISYNITYSIDSTGVATVDYNIILTNLVDNLYAASESLTLTQTDIYDVNVMSTSGVKQSYQLTKADGASTITTTFTSPAVGQNSSNHWDVIYKTKQVATLSGGTWSILVPGFGDKAGLNISDLQIHIIAPRSFGPENYVSPAPSSTSSSGDSITYTYNNDSINSSGISLVLGTQAVYSFNFNYPVSNSTDGIQEYTIAVPIDTKTQAVTFTKVDPTPDKFSINADGDYVLSYELGSHKSGTLDVSGLASVSPIKADFSQKFPSPRPLSASEQKALTAGMKYWEVSNPKIQDLSKTLTQGKTSNIDKARAIYDYVVQNFKYNRNALFDANRQRKGALYAINNPTDVICQEYVDAFVALARAAGVPAVFDAGYGNTTSPLNTLPPNVLHAWVEFYDPDYGWISADPTWASTSGMDFWGNLGSSHFLLARYGYDSENPILVLAFSTRNDSANNIKLSPSGDAFVDDANFTINPNVQTTIQTGLSSVAGANIINSGNRVLQLQDSTITYNGTTLHSLNNSIDIFPTMNANINYSTGSNSIFVRNTYKGNLIATFTDTNGTNGLKKIFLINVLVTPAWYVTLIPILAVILIFMISYTLVSLTIRLHRRIAKTE